ncbi:N-acyl homoserine lactonase family protein [Angustibacter sp. McL0619]|uniref:N-acyl homoserine lactonase family protein n=1 Tax=Angustibacter sp. McL0619 TaxID=3415676 RepID=UPI003CEB2F56
MTNRATRVDRLGLGGFLRPGSETVDGQPRVEVVLAYLVHHPEGLLLLDTGMGSHPEVDAHYRPWRTDLRAALRTRGVSLDDVRLVVNCHLHFDHCGGNPLLAGVPVFAQRTERELAEGADYTLPELVDFPGVRYELLDGAAELLPGVRVLATPGHTAGHQSLAVQTDDGTVVLAGQSHDHASDFTAHALAASWPGSDGNETAAAPSYPAWMDEILALDPRRVLFAHDEAVWEPSRAPHRTSSVGGR